MIKFRTVLMSFCFTILFGGVAFAATVSEVEPNNSSMEVQLIQKNNANPAKVINGNYDGESVLVGKLSDNTDVDWYKVYLFDDSATLLSINSTALSGSGTFEVYDENLKLISKVTHQKDYAILGATPYYVDIPSAGYYYIKVSNLLRGGDYRFTIGGPNYFVDTYNYTASSDLTLTRTIKSTQAIYDLRNISTISDKAIVYKVLIGGTKSNNTTTERSIKLDSDYSWTSTSMYNYNADISVSSNKLLKSRWMVKIDGDVLKPKTSFTLTPKIRFDYIYPILPH